MNPNYKTLDVTEPKNGLVVYKDGYWICKDSDPKQAYFFGTSPQSNSNKAISEWVLKRTFEEKDNVGIVFIPIAYIPQRY